MTDLPLTSLLNAVAVVLLAVLAWTDLTDRRLPAPLVRALIAVGVAAAALSHGVLGLAWACASAALAAAPIWLLSEIGGGVGGVRRVGGGDLRYAVALGSLLGAPLALLVLAGGAALAGAVGVMGLVVWGRAPRRIPFATCCAFVLAGGLLLPSGD